MKVLIVHAHHEAGSFCSALKDTSVRVLSEAGHDVVVSDLYAMDFDPVSDRRNFATVADPDYLKQQKEEMHASEVNGFAAEVMAEIEKLEACDLLIFHFPLWWFGMPAIMKGWCDRVLVMGRVYGGGKWYDDGVKQGARAIACITTGGPESMYLPDGLNGDMNTLMYPLNHGVFGFLGFDVLPQHVAWGPTRAGEDGRKQMLTAWEERLGGIESEPPIDYPKLAEFDENFRRRR